MFCNKQLKTNRMTEVKQNIDKNLCIFKDSSSNGGYNFQVTFLYLKKMSDFTPSLWI